MSDVVMDPTTLRPAVSYAVKHSTYTVSEGGESLEWSLSGNGITARQYNQLLEILLENRMMLRELFANTTTVPLFRGRDPLSNDDEDRE